MTNHLPPKADTALLSDVVAVDPPEGFDAMAGGFPIWADPVEVLDPEAYTKIRRSPAAAHPVRKLGVRLSRYRLEAQGEGPRVEFIQELLDRMPRLKSAIRGLVWGIVDGVIFGWLHCPRGATDDGLVIPEIAIRKKVKAGGRLEWNGKIVVQQQLLFLGAVANIDGNGAGGKAMDFEAKTLDRRKLIVFSPEVSSSPEGSADLAHMLYLIAFEYEQATKNQSWYSKRFGAPWEILKQSVERMRPGIASGQRKAAQDKLDSMNRQGINIALKQHIELLEPGGNTSEFLGDYTDTLRKIAHLLVLLNTLTSETQDAGPTGSSNVHKSEEDEAVDSVGAAISEAFTADLLPFLEYYNGGLLPEGKIDRLLLIPPATQRELSHGELIEIYNSGLELDADWFYGEVGAPVPKQLQGQTIKKEAPDPFAGFGGFGRDDDEEEDDEPADDMDQQAVMARLVADWHETNEALKETREYEKQELVGKELLRVMDDEVDDLIEAEVTRTSKVFAEALVEVAHGRPVPNMLAQEIAEAMARAQILGENRLDRQLPKEARFTAEHTGLIGWRFQTDGTEAPSLEQIAEDYREFGISAAKAANATLRDRIDKKLVEFIKQAVRQPRDTEEFVEWLLKTDPKLTENYARLVLRNAVNTAYSAGRLKRFEGIAQLLGLTWQYFTVGDAKVRPEHRIYAGKVFPADAKWQKWMPPNDHNCRCTWAPSMKKASAGIENLPAPAWNFAPGSRAA